jgi:N-methylhydantoinase B
VYHKVHGSGGYGDPYERDAELVVLDVVEGKISLERAREVYGVVIDPERLALDRDATLALRGGRKDALVAAAD